MFSNSKFCSLDNKNKIIAKLIEILVDLLRGAPDGEATQITDNWASASDFFDFSPA